MKKVLLGMAFLFGFFTAALASSRKLDLSISSMMNTQPPVTSSPQQTFPQVLTRFDDQGAVTIEVEPENLSNPGETILFKVKMNTHSVDLSMDLALLSSLSSGDGRVVQALLWDAPRGGHHVSGVLSFPASVDGKPLIDRNAGFILTIKNVDVPQRIFIWDLKQ